MATIQSLVEHGTFAIDNSQFLGTGDKYFYQGHFYSDKPPILAMYGSVYYFFLKIFGITFSQYKNLTYYFLTLLTVGVSTCVGMVYFYKILNLLKIEEKWADVVVLVTGAGTLLLPYSTVFNNHTVSGVLLLIGFYCLLKIKIQKSLKDAFFIGFIVTLAGSIDITTFLFLPFFTIAFFNKQIKSKLAFILGCVPVVFVYFGLNIYTSGSLIPPAMNKALWNYPGSYFGENSLSGVAHFSDIPSLLNYAYHMLLGNRGLISYTPILIFSFYGFVKLLFNREFKYRKEYVLMFVASCSYVLLYIFRSNNFSGWAYGVRWYADLMFLLCLPIAHIYYEIHNLKAVRILFFITASISILVSFVGAIYPFTAAEVPTSSSFLNAFIYYVLEANQYIPEGDIRILFKQRFIMITIVASFILVKFIYNYRKFIKSSIKTINP
ncbi:hypothetical protein [Aetokthonos hydrillicola]